MVICDVTIICQYTEGISIEQYSDFIANLSRHNLISDTDYC